MITKTQDQKIILTLFCLLTLTKLILIFYLGDTKDALFNEGESNEWGTLYLNLKNFGEMSWFSSETIKFPNGFMPPLYVYFIYIHSFISEVHLVQIILFSQMLISLLTSFFFFKLCLKKLSYNESILAFSIFSFYPLNLYGSTQISSVTLVLFIYVIFLYFVISKKNIFLISIIAAFGIMARGEFKFLYLIFLIYFIINKKFSLQKILLSLLLTISILSPQIIKNYITFERIFITHSSGYVLWRGNNELSTVTSIKADQIIGSVEKSILRPSLKLNYNLIDIPQQYKDIGNELNSIKNNPKYDVLRDDIFKKYVFKNLFTDPLRHIKLYIKKIISFIFFNLESDYPNYYHPFSIVPEIILSIGAVLGFILSIQNYKKYLVIYIYLFFMIAIYSLLLILPRYKLFLLPGYVVFFSILIFKTKNYLKKLLT